MRLLGLNPYCGWLHDASGPYESLVYDLMEPMRPFVDRLALRLINRQELRARHFDDATGQWRMESETARLVAERFEQALGERVQGVVLRELLWHQVRSVRELVLERGGLWLYRWEPRQMLPAPPEPQVLTLQEVA